MPVKPALNVLFTGLLLSAALPASVASEMSEFEAYKRQHQAGVQQYKDEFEEYRKALKAAFEEYKRKTAGVWGKDNVMPASNNWVLYQNDLSQRSVVDFEKGTVKVDIAVPADAGLNEKAIQEKLRDNIQALLRQGPDTRPMQEVARKPAITPGTRQDSHTAAVLAQLVADQDGKPLAQRDYDRLAEELSRQPRKKVVRGNDGKQRVIYEAQFRLVPDHIRKRAEKYQPSVNRNARQQQLQPELVFAVIETESWFNPTARSAAPAFGLMQLVPTSGARDAYKKLYGRDRIVTDTYLYNPDNNIKLGTAYLNLLYYQYFSGIKSPQSRLWATIAAYNTGAGNVFRTFAGRYSRARFGSRSRWKQAALREINRRTPEQVFRHMQRALPYQETRDYIVKVRGRMKKYSGQA